MTQHHFLVSMRVDSGAVLLGPGTAGIVIRKMRIRLTQRSVTWRCTPS
jgi:hypothetical protein